MKKKIKTIVADHHRLFRAGLVAMLKHVEAIDVVGEAEDGEQAVELTRRLAPHVATLELAMPGIGGLEATRRIRNAHPGTKVVMVTGAWDAPYPSQSMRAGARGFVTKRGTIEEVVQAIKRAFTGRRFVSADIAEQMALQGFDDASRSPFDRLTSRELQVVLMVVNCQRVHDISASLRLSVKTVNSYRYRVFEKLGVSSDVELALLAVKHGMVNPLLNAADGGPLGPLG